MMAAIQQGGKQYLVKEGMIIQVEKIDLEKDSEFKFENVTMIVGPDMIKFSKEEVKNFTVNGVVLAHKKTDKVIVFKKKRRHNYRRKNGHRQNVTLVKITKINEQ